MKESIKKVFGIILKVLRLLCGIIRHYDEQREGHQTEQKKSGYPEKEKIEDDTK